MTATQGQGTVTRRPASGISISAEQLTRMRDLRALSREELAERAGEVLFDYDHFAHVMAGQGSAGAQLARALWLALDTDPETIMRGLPAGLPRAAIPRWLRRNGGWYLDTRAVQELQFEYGWTDQVLARNTARHWFSRDSVAKIERGERRPKPKTLRAFAKVLRCKPADLQSEDADLPDGRTKARKDLMDYNTDMRDWADAQDPPVPYRNLSGRISYSKDLRDRYAAYRSAQDAAAELSMAS